jgi:hypothetical protein
MNLPGRAVMAVGRHFFVGAAAPAALMAGEAAAASPSALRFAGFTLRVRAGSLPSAAMTTSCRPWSTDPSTTQRRPFSAAAETRPWSSTVAPMAKAFA